MSLTNIAKAVATLANAAKTAVKNLLLKEDGFYLLLETGDKIILEESDTMVNLTKTAA